MDAVKSTVADTVYDSLDPSTVAKNLGHGYLREDGPQSCSVDISRIDGLTSIIKIATDHGPRYFQVRVSEMM